MSTTNSERKLSLVDDDDDDLEAYGLEPLPPLCGEFPRTEWLDAGDFGIPPYGPGEDAYEVAWAACEASRSWARVKAGSVSAAGSVQVQGGDYIDRTCFMLAVLDKAFEVNAYYGLVRCTQYPLPPLSYLDWLEDMDGLIEDLYETACMELKGIHVPHDDAPPLAEIRGFVREALNRNVHDVWRPTDVPPLPQRAGKLNVGDLGRFAAKYFAHQHLIMRPVMDSPDPDAYVSIVVRTKPDEYKSSCPQASSPVSVSQLHRAAKL